MCQIFEYSSQVREEESTFMTHSPNHFEFRERSTRDQAIIRLTLYLWRNLTAIVDPKASSISSGEKVLLSKLQVKMECAFMRRILNTHH